MFPLVANHPPWPNSFHLPKQKHSNQCTLTPFLTPSYPDNFPSHSRLYKFPFSRVLINLRPYNIYPAVPGLFHLAECLQGTFMLSRGPELPFWGGILWHCRYALDFVSPLIHWWHWAAFTLGLLWMMHMWTWYTRLWSFYAWFYILNMDSALNQTRESHLREADGLEWRPDSWDGPMISSTTVMFWYDPCPHKWEQNLGLAPHWQNRAAVMGQPCCGC